MKESVDVRHQVLHQDRENQLTSKHLSTHQYLDKVFFH
jgi:hypothetical protein